MPQQKHRTTSVWAECSVSGTRSGDILTTLRRIDEHWIEAKLGGKVGICPRQFMEPNPAAAKLLKGKSRSGSDSAEPHHQYGSGGKNKAADASSRSAHYGVPQVQAKTPVISALRKQPAVSSNISFQPPTNISSSISFKPPSAPRSHSYPRRVSRMSRRSDSHRHLLQVSRTLHTLHLFFVPYLRFFFFWVVIYWNRKRGWQK
ncbi:hypothetical protein GOODEAATRI_022078 [Goodea atripinnis]|uniref:SH3 domain-containing protein n=1 Tax=Goodea atripinnis TaxID=208336 RepID=A0ABV0MUB2_9TELE